jgi:hypothetical protein
MKPEERTFCNIEQIDTEKYTSQNVLWPVSGAYRDKSANISYCF